MAAEYPQAPAAESVMRDEAGHEFIRLGIGVRRDIITELGFTLDPELPADIAEAMTEMTALAKDKAIMAASLIRAADLVKALPADDPGAARAAAVAELMLHECLRNYSMNYNLARAERLRKRDQAGKE